MAKPNYGGATQGIATAVAHQQAVQPNYLDQAELIILQAYTQVPSGTRVSWDDLRLLVESKLGKNIAYMSWGALAQRLTGKNGIFRRLNITVPSKIPGCHARSVPLYERL